jgi:formylglycine-generating enzyme
VGYTAAAAVAAGCGHRQMLKPTRQRTHPLPTKRAKPNCVVSFAFSLRTYNTHVPRFLTAAFVAAFLWGCSKPADTSGMVRIEGGEFLMGTDDGFPFEGPVHRVVLDSFWMDETEVTNEQFARFVEETGYVTTAEQLGDSGVFDPSISEWTLVQGANWRRPRGPNSSIDGRMDYPVIHVSWDDADAYCRWAGKRLPTEAEFEYAARGGMDGKTFAWGDELMPGGEHLANTWQGAFPIEDRGEDGFKSYGPVKQFPANPYGLYDITGNVWEWVADWYDPEYYRVSPARNPRGPKEGVEKVQRGGSWLCSTNYCQGYRVAARMKTEPDSGLNNLGFRCAAD